MAKVATYKLIYTQGGEVELCDSCADSETHECGALGEVSHGLHEGECDGARHAEGEPCNQAAADEAAWLADAVRVMNLVANGQGTSPEVIRLAKAILERAGKG